MEPITFKGVLIEFDKPDSNGKVYSKDAFDSIKSFGSVDYVLTHGSEEDAVKNELHTIIGRSKIKADDLKIYHETSLFNTVATDKFFDKYGKNSKKYEFIPHIINGELISVSCVGKKK